MQYTSILPSLDLENKAAAANAFFKKGCYIGFKKAIEIYRKLYAEPSIRNEIIVPFIKALILMTVRERELGILNDSYIQMASNVIKGYPALRFFAPYIELVNWMYPKTRGIMRDIDTVGTAQIVNTFLKNDHLNAEMQLRARSDDYFAYLYVKFNLEYANYLGKKEDFGGFVRQYPDSILFKYKNATTFPRENQELLEALLKAEPEFYEVYYHLGELALGVDKPLYMGGNILGPFEAEKYFLKAYEGIPESPQITIYLGGIYVLTEEYDQGIEYFDKTLALAPTYRDAMLGKSICLSYMGKYKEAIDILNNLVTLGSYLMGESHYWLAWNYHELKDIEEAQFNIEESKTRLPTESEVFSLAGTIWLEKSEFDKAEREFIESLRYNGKNINAIVGLGDVYAQEKKWLDSAEFYSRGIKDTEQRESVLAENTMRIENSTLEAERKARIIAQKKRQHKILEETKASACYNAAVGYSNGGQRAKALEMAAKAATNPQFKEVAEQLIKQIK